MVSLTLNYLFDAHHVPKVCDHVTMTLLLKSILKCQLYNPEKMTTSYADL